MRLPPLLSLPVDSQLVLQNPFPNPCTDLECYENFPATQEDDLDHVVTKVDALDNDVDEWLNAVDSHPPLTAMYDRSDDLYLDFFQLDPKCYTTNSFIKLGWKLIILILIGI